ncbi:phosphate uptake regulator PhoU [Euzebya sp.]|uniref:phosphate signaling complex PhoU family protein n=1 Tax=Euzebya sp. TaxID=1971409 RepID=UPI00351907E1
MSTARMLRLDFRSAMRDLEDGILLLGRRTQHLVGVAMSALEQASPELAAEVLAVDDEVDVTAHGLEEDLRGLVTLQAPVADDLRLLLSLQRVLIEVERIGDGCVNIARLGRDLAGAGGEAPELVAQMHELGRRAERAVRTGLDSFGQRRRTVELVGEVEDQIDLLHDGLTGRLIDHAAAGRAQTGWAVRMVLACRHLERIGDHAVNIAEEGSFVATGSRPLPRSLR